MKNTFIRPYRIIPFDIGGDISYGEIESIVGKFNKTGDNKAEILPLDGFQKKLSSRILCGYKVTDNISFFIYSFGIGVFSVRDNDFEIDGMESEYAPAIAAAGRRHIKIFLPLKRIIRKNSEPL